ncbi:MAG: LytTR family DNA-binding domain-containing protein [Lachnospiraceae bacterium]|nr:LytTR family DNA-binding domain-containing protein [Lachnospiraceae bacterium]
MAVGIGICDDEEFQIKLNKLCIEEIAAKNNWKIECHSFGCGSQVLDFIKHNHLDILFLDIVLREESGIQVAAQIAEQYPDLRVIFVTGHTEFFSEAFEVGAMGYLVKPYDIQKMEKIMYKALIQASTIRKEEAHKEIIIMESKIKKKINVGEIIHIKREFSKSVIYTKQNTYKVYEPVCSIFERLGDGFLKVNQGEIVNIKEILAIKGNMVVLKNGMEIRIGRTYCKEVKGKYWREEN